MHDLFQTYPTFGQTYPGMGAISAFNNPFASPYAAMQPQLNPAAFYNTLAANAGVPWNVGIGAQQTPFGYGIASQIGANPWQNPFAGVGQQNPFAGVGQQNPFAAVGQQNPFAGVGQQNPFAGVGQQNPFAGGQQQNPFAGLGLQNPLMAGGLQNPFAAAALQNPLLNPQITALLAQQYSQLAQPYGLGQVGQGLGQLAPQTWVGHGHGHGQINPVLLQTIARAIQSQGYTPWGI